MNLTRRNLLGLCAASALALPADIVMPVSRGNVRPARISVFAHYVHNVAKEREISLGEAAGLLFDQGVRGFDDHYVSKKLPELAATKLKPVNLYGWVTFRAPDGGEAEMTAFLGTAKRFGVPRVMVIPDRFTQGGDEEAEFGEMVAGLRKMVARAKGMGITVTVEDFGGDPLSPCNRMVYLKRFLDEIPDLRLALDSGNLYYARRGEDILELMRHAEGRIAHVHLKDQLPSDQRTYAELGVGGVPNREIVHHVTRQGYDGWFTLENTVPGADTLLETVRQVATLRAWRQGL